MNKSDAQSIAGRYISDLENEIELELALNPEVVEEYEVGFVFFYNTREYWNTRDYRYALAGNGPLLVRRDSGELVELPSNQSVERSLSQLARAAG